MKKNGYSKLFLFLTICSISAVAFTHRVFVKSGYLAESVSARNANQPPQTVALAANLTRFGFEPNSVTIPAGTCVVMVRNLVGKGQLDFQIKRRDSNVILITDKQPKGKGVWEKPLQFGVGEYVITDASNPEWKLELTVVPRSGQ